MDFAAARHNMVENQIRTNRVTDPLVIEALAELPREHFVPDELASIAYLDHAIPVAPGRYLLEPLVLARMLQTVEIKPDDLVLQIGCGTGYAAAALARMASAVVAVESDPALAATATETLSRLGIDTVAVVTAALTDGHPKQAPYDVIFVNGGVSQVPPAIAEQLAEGGRMIAVVLDAAAPGGLGKATLFGRYGGALSSRHVFDAGAPLLPGFEAAPTFAF